MADAKHTPGPWAAVFHKEGAYMGGVARDCWTVDGPDLVPDYEDTLYREGDARLIAAAPELLALVKLVHGSFGGGLTVTFSEQDVADFAAAIAKAEGRE